MDSPNSLNVYKGSDSLQSYYNPDLQPPLPLVELPDVLNPFRADGVRIYAKMMTVLPANNVKALPALNMLSSSVIPGQTKKIIEYSSGSTVISMSIIARVFHGIDDTHAFLSNKTSEAKLKLMQFFGLNITLFGGPSQPEPGDVRGGIQGARREAEESEHIANPNQYENDANWQAHSRWTGPQILKQLPEINVVCAGMGTSGTMTGIGTFFQKAKPSVVRIAVCTAPGDRVPGPRSFALMSPVLFPWRKAVDVIEEVGANASYTLSMELSREGLICGPSSGFNLQGLYQFIEKHKSAGTLGKLAGRDGSVHCVFLCCDLPYQYMSEYFTQLDSSKFQDIQNRNLAAVDLHRYDEVWELDATDAMTQYFDSASGLPMPVSSEPGRNLGNFFGDSTPKPTLKPDTILLDLRSSEDFAIWNLPWSVNVPLLSLTSTSPGPFADPLTLEQQWLELQAIFEPETTVAPGASLPSFHNQRVLVLCYDGDTARVATSLLRAKGIAASSLKGGLRGLLLRWPELQVARPTVPGTEQPPNQPLTTAAVTRGNVTPAILSPNVADISSLGHGVSVIS